MRLIALKVLGLKEEEGAVFIGKFMQRLLQDLNMSSVTEEVFVKRKICLSKLTPGAQVGFT